jgi:SAM-dependent methyltransferase
MTLSKSDEWILPEKLKDSEKLQRKLVESGNYNGEGDFGSYYAYRKGINMEWIKAHAVNDEILAKKIAERLQCYLEIMGKSMVNRKIIDIGCAIGIITNEIGKINGGGETIGLDISEDAIEYAKETYPACKYYARAADDLDIFKNNHFDIIFTREFYPFTRTNDLETQAKYLRIFKDKLARNGIFVCEIGSRKVGIFKTYKLINYKDIGLKNLGRYPIVPIKIFPFFKIMMRHSLLIHIIDGLMNVYNLIRGERLTFYYIFQKQ